MKTIIIISTCIKISRLSPGESWYHFHFKGIYEGEILRKVLLRGRKEFLLERNGEYLLYVQMISCSKGILTGNILKVKSLDECFDRS